MFSSNPNGISLLEQHPEKIDIDCWHELLRNPNIFTYDYDAIREQCLIFKEDLIKNRFHPRNLNKFKAWGIEEFEDWEDDAF
jgi:hypothetical protein